MLVDPAVVPQLKPEGLADIPDNVHFATTASAKALAPNTNLIARIAGVIICEGSGAAAKPEVKTGEWSRPIAPFTTPAAAKPPPPPVLAVSASLH